MFWYNGVYGEIMMGTKIKTSIALDKELIIWIDQMINIKRFASRTHAIEFALQKLIESGFS